MRNWPISLEEQADIDRLVALSRCIVDHHAKTLDLGNRKATDINGINNIKLPGPLPTKNEAELSLRQQEFRRVFADYQEEYCLSSGKQKSNLTRSQRLGLDIVKKKVKEGIYIVAETDKSGKFAVCSLEAYLQMGNVHTAKDIAINEDDVIKIHLKLR